MSGQGPTSHNHPGQARGYLPEVLRRIGALAIATIAVMRCAIAFAPQLVFDVDPAVFPGVFGGVGPAGSLWLDVMLLVAAACGLAGEALSKRGVDWMLLLLVFLPLPIVLGHGHGDRQGEHHRHGLTRLHHRDRHGGGDPARHAAHRGRG